MNEHFYNGFIKRAQDYGFTAIEATNLAKTAAIGDDVLNKMEDWWGNMGLNNIGKKLKNYGSTLHGISPLPNDLGTNTLDMSPNYKHHPTKPHVLIPTLGGELMGRRPTTYNPRTLGGVNPGETVVGERELLRRDPGYQYNPAADNPNRARARRDMMEKELEYRMKLNPESEFYKLNEAALRNNLRVPTNRANSEYGKQLPEPKYAWPPESLKYAPIKDPSLFDQR